MRSRLTLAAFLLAFGAIDFEYAVAAERVISVAGGQNVAWAWRRVPTSSNKRQLVVAFARGGTDQPRFFLLPMRPATGEIELAAVRGESLHVFFRDGTHYRLQPPQPLMRADVTAKNDYPELRLPDGRVPLAACADAGASGLFAIIEKSTARRIIEAAAAEAKAEKKTDSPEPDADVDTNAAAPPTPAPDLSTTGFALARFAPGAWSAVAAMPESFDDHASVWMAFAQGGLNVLYARNSDPTRLCHYRFADDAWTEQAERPPVEPASVIGVCAPGDTLVLLTRAPSDAHGPEAEQRVVLRPVLWKDQSWQRGEPLRAGESDQWFDADGFAAGRMGDDLLVVWMSKGSTDQAETLLAARWPAAGGAMRAEAVPAPALATAPPPISREYTQLLIMLALMTIILIVVVRKRRESFITDLPVPEGYVLARLGRRLVAFMLDVAVVGVVAFPVLAVPWMAKQGVMLDADFRQRLVLAWSQDPSGVFWRWLAAAGIFALYCSVFETTLAATPGKFAVGLRVCGHRAEPASLIAIVLRNVFRFELFPSFSFSPLIVLVVVTRNRQRLGDLVANTLVVEKA